MPLRCIWRVMYSSCVFVTRFLRAISAESAEEQRAPRLSRSNSLIHRRYVIALLRRVFEGIVPRWTHSPPMAASRSIRSTDAPALQACTAAF
jgi:hypothetical protein